MAGRETETRSIDMLLLVFRILPFLAAGISAWLMQMQWREPFLFPLPLLGMIAVYGCSAACLSWKRSTWREYVGRTLPTFITLCGALVAAALFEGNARLGLTVFTATTVFIALELLFFLLFHPARYPVNGLTHFHLGLVPASIALFVWGTVGWWMFARTGPFERYAPEILLIVGIFSALGGGFFFLTSHPDATPRQRSAWAIFGGFIGFCCACLIFLLPIPLEAHALLAALLISIPLRIRRYAYAPVPTIKGAFLEGGFAMICFFAVLLLSRWA